MSETSINATAASLLGLLQQGPATGWELLERAERQLGNFWTVTRSQVYRELTALAGAGLIRAHEREQRDRQPYELIAAGRRAFLAWLAEPPSHESIRYPLLLTVAFGAALPAAELRELLAGQRRVHEARLDAYCTREDELAASDVGPYALATLRFGIRHEQATLDWFDDLVDLLPD